MHYYLTKSGYKIDFVAEYQNGTYELLQVIWDITEPGTEKREERALLEAEKELGIKGRIITPQSHLQKDLL